MTNDERIARLQKILRILAAENRFITPAQIHAAIEQYSNDPRPISEIETELVRQSHEIMLAGKEKEKGSLPVQKKYDKNPINKQNHIPDKREKDGLPKPNYQPPVNDDKLNPEDEIDRELASLFDPKNPQPQNPDGKLGQVVSESDETDPTDRIDSLFDTPPSHQDFTEVDSLGERENPKVYTKNINAKEYNNPKGDSGNGEGGFSSFNTLATIATLFSIMGILISMLILYTV